MNETITFIRKSLETLYPPEEIRSLTEWILEKVCNLPRHQQILRKDIQLSCVQSDSIRTIVRRLQNSEPIQYVLGETEFLGLTFEVSPAVLIPRPETEELVHRIIQEFKIQNSKFKISSPTSPTSPISPISPHSQLSTLNSQLNISPTFPINILDIGTGSGCIAVTLAKHMPAVNVYALDISHEALQIAHRNAQRNDVLVHFFQTDILSTPIRHDLSLPKFDIIVSNPPYVTDSEKSAMKPNVLDYEPHTALFVPDDDPILFYRRIADFALEKLTENGFLYVEINSKYGEMICRMLRRKGFSSAEQIRDISGKERFIKARK